jgi:glutathione S-transferase
MILIGQYDSSFVRRVGIAARIYGFDFEHWPWSVFADKDKIAKYNPLSRVPTLVLDDGHVLVDSNTIIDFLDRQAGQERALFPSSNPARHHQMNIASIATGIAEKGVARFYEIAMYERDSTILKQRFADQVAGVMDYLEAACLKLDKQYWFGDEFGHADIAVTCMIAHMKASHPVEFDMKNWPALSALSEGLEAKAVFKEIYQPFIAPA